MQKRPSSGRPSQPMVKLKPVWMLVALHIAVLGCALLLYALFHHVIPRQEQAVGTQSSRYAVSAMAVQETPLPTLQAVVSETPVPTAIPDPTPTPEPVGYFGTKFAGKFTSGAVEMTENTYVSANVNVTVTNGQFAGSNYNVADIYIKDIASLVTAFAEEKYGKGYAEYPKTFAQKYNAVVTINGDYYGMRDNGVVIRNGTLYRDEKIVNDVCVIYWDGTMKTFDPFNFDAQAEIANGAYQAWCFGPYLLDGNGKAMTAFNSTVKKENPRSMIGYYEPGHYCFVTVDGREENSEGLDMLNTAALMEHLGCKAAYNLDGGKSSAMLKGTTVVGNPVGGGRDVSDVIMILDIAGEVGA